jgi:hypothetical protein
VQYIYRQFQVLVAVKKSCTPISTIHTFQTRIIVTEEVERICWHSHCCMCHEVYAAMSLCTDCERSREIKICLELLGSLVVIMTRVIIYCDFPIVVHF